MHLSGMAKARQPTDEELRVIRKITDQRGGAAHLAKASGLAQSTIARAAARQPIYPTILAHLLAVAAGLERVAIPTGTTNQNNTGEKK